MMGYNSRSEHTWYDNKVRELIAVEVLHASLLNITVVAFKVLPLGSYAPMPEPSPPFKTILELFKYYVSGHYPSSCLYLKTVLFIFKTQRFGD
jgi:hypothetical protein